MVLKAAATTLDSRGMLVVMDKGHSDRSMGDVMFLSPRTVNAHVRNILAKTHTKNRTELSLWAVREGLVRQEPGSA